MNRLTGAVTAGILSLTLTACSGGMVTGGAAIPDRIVAARGGFIPEGIDYDNTGRRFLTGSLADGNIYEIANNGRLTALVSDPEVSATVGIEVDEPRSRVLAAIGDLAAGRGAAGLGVYDLNSGARLALVDLAASLEDPPADASFFANDVAVSRAGVVYVTDFRMNLVYEVDRYFRARVLVDLGRDAGFNLNGIEYHPAGYLLVVSTGSGQLIKIPVNAPQRWSVVALDFPATGGDGLVWAADGSLVSTSNNTGSVMKFRSDDNWASARLVGMASFEGQATTAAAVGEDIYVVQPNFGSDAAPVILRAVF